MSKPAPTEPKRPTTREQLDAAKLYVLALERAVVAKDMQIEELSRKLILAAKGKA